MALGFWNLVQCLAYCNPCNGSRCYIPRPFSACLAAHSCQQGLAGAEKQAGIRYTLKNRRDLRNGSLMKHIVSRDNPGFKALRVLLENAREARRQGLALLEGLHLLQAYRDKVGLPKRLVVSEHGLKQPEIQVLLASLGGVELWCLSDALFGQLSEMVTPVGIFSLIEIPEPAALSWQPGGSCVLLDGVQDAGNVGSILRTAAAAGVCEVFLGRGCAAAWSPRVLRAGQGAHFDLHIHEHADLQAVMSACQDTAVAATAHGEAGLYGLDLQGPVAWLFGSEGQGISPELEAAAQRRVTIPLAAGCESLNVAAAAAICLFEEVRQKRMRMP